MPILILTPLLLCLSTLAAFAARAAGLPLPFLIGPLLLTGLTFTLASHRLPREYRFPARLRLVFIALIGVAIGAQITPELFAEPGALALSAGALVLFIILAHSWGYAVMRWLGGYDRPTAFYSAAPGGLFEAIAMGEEAGADPARLTLQQFLRIIVVVTLLPIGLSLWYGEPVGSSAGMSFAAEIVTIEDVVKAALAGMAGLGLGHILRLPAKQITGPMGVAGLATATGLFHPDLPQWLIDTAQIVVGTALGTRFGGMSKQSLIRGIWLTLIAVGGMLCLSALFAAVLMIWLDQPFDILLISFAPGGVTEMSLVALSLTANPAFVTLHHIARIIMTVIGLALCTRYLARKKETDG
ncbi:MAG: AbrB family transcriptional regulator [Pseudomonadota bacterium]